MGGPRMPGRAMPHRTRAGLIADIYDAALEPGAWPGFAAPFAEALDRRNAFFWIGDRGRPVEGAVHGLPVSAFERYAAYYGQTDLWAAAAIDRGPSLRAAIGSEQVSEQRFRNSEFYFDYARGYDTIDAVGAAVPLGHGRVGVLGILCETGGRPFEAHDVANLESLLPHLQRALQLRRRLAEARRGEVGLAALDALAFGAVVCEAGGRVRFANAAAEQMARSGTGLVLRDAGGGISAAHAEESVELALLVADAARGGAGGGMAVTDEAGGIILVLVAPLPRRFIDQPWLVLVTLRPATASPTVSDRTLARLFGLTPAEARLALALLAGRSLAEIGAERRVTENTLRTQLAKVLRKTDTANQRSLVRLLGLLPPIR